jgi:hypothetical protein
MYNEFEQLNFSTENTNVPINLLFINELSS